MRTEGSPIRIRHLVAAAAAIGLLAIPAPVAAHAEFVTSTPAPNSSLPESPEELILEFSEAVDPGTVVVRLLDPRQLEVPTPDDPTLESGDERVRLGLPPLDPGVYTVEYRVVSAVDGHTTSGLFAFLVDPTGIEPPPAVPAETATTADDPATIAARWVALLGGVTLFGIATFWLISATPAARALGRGSLGRVAVWPVLAGAAFLSFAGTAAYLTLAARAFASPVTDAAGHPGTVTIPFDFAAPFGWTPFAIAMRVSLIAALVAFLVAAVLTVFSDEQRRRGDSAQAGTARAPLLAVIAVAAIGLAGFSAAGHASSYGGLVFAVSDWLHLVGVAAWLGALPGLLLLGILARRTAMPGVMLAAVRRHGVVALAAAPLVVLTGIANAPLVVGEQRELLASGYGNLVLAKALLFSVAVGIGSVNFMLGRGARGRVGLAVIGAELVVAAAAVLAAAAMVTIQPAAARSPVLSSSELGAVHLYGVAGESNVHAAVDLPSPGSQTYQVVVHEAATGAPRADIQRVFIVFEPPEGSGLPPERVRLEQGHEPWLYATHGAYTPVVGEWTLEIVVRRAGELDETARFPLPVVEPLPPQPVPPPSTGLVAPAPLAWLWAVLPTGRASWLLPLLLMAGAAALAVTERSWLRRGDAPSKWGAPARAALVAAAVVIGIGIGSRQLVVATNQPPPARATITSPVPADDASIARGRNVYLANCAACHGPDGDPDAAALPQQAAPRPLAGSVAELSEGELAWIITAGRAGTRMPAFADTLSENDRWDLVNFLRDRWATD